jgi:hypothetical protein
MFVSSRVSATRKGVAGFVVLRGRNLPRAASGSGLQRSERRKVQTDMFCTTRPMIGVAVWSGVRLCPQAAAGTGLNSNSAMPVIGAVANVAPGPIGSALLILS